MNYEQLKEKLLHSPIEPKGLPSAYTSVFEIQKTIKEKINDSNQHLIRQECEDILMQYLEERKVRTGAIDFEAFAGKYMKGLSEKNRYQMDEAINDLSVYIGILICVLDTIYECLGKSSFEYMADICKAILQLEDEKELRNLHLIWNIIQYDTDGGVFGGIKIC